MKICYFGDYDANYSRNRVLMKGLRENGVEIFECNSLRKGLGLYLDLYRKHRNIRDCYDILLVAQSFHSRLVWFAKLLTGKKIVWDAFYSFYDKYVFDSKLISPKSLRGRYYWWMEKIACHLADLILLDTNEHIRYFSDEFGVSFEKFKRVLVGSDIDINDISPRVSSPDLKVFFYGNYTPLQGARHIIKAAKILENMNGIRFVMVGSGQTYADDRRLADEMCLKNISFLPRLPFKNLVKNMAEADVCLGIFGDNPKAKRVIPNKVYEAAALKKPIISPDTLAVGEIFENFKNILLCKSSDSADLAKKILELRNNQKLRKTISEGGHRLFLERCTPSIIAKKLLDDLKTLGI